MTTVKEAKRISRHKRIRAKIRGTEECPRLCVHRGLRNMHLQLINDTKSKTLLSLSTRAKELRDKLGYCGNLKAATLLGEMFAQKAAAKGIKRAVFDRSGFAYQGRVKALAEALRKGGLIF